MLIWRKIAEAQYVVQSLDRQYSLAMMSEERCTKIVCYGER